MSTMRKAPVPDKTALAEIGERVRGHLKANPHAYRFETDRAEIWAIGDVFDEDECDRLIALINKTAVPSEVLAHGQTEIWRTSSSGNVDAHDPFVRSIEDKIDSLLGLPHEYGELMQGQRYEVGQEFRYHLDLFWTEADYWKDEAGRGGQRTITAMAYLNDVEEGGETAFTELGIAVRPRRGALLIWNNNLPDGTPNENTMHAGVPVTKGVKYIITKWYRSRKWG